MKRLHASIITGGITVMLLASCGQQYSAERTVKTFVEANMEEADRISSRDFADIGTTRHIGDSLIDVMRHRGAPLFRKDIPYGQKPEGELYYLRMRYVHNGDTLQNTFYLNSELTEVVAFK